MQLIHTFHYDAGFNLQADVDLINKTIDITDGPDRAYLIYPYQNRHGEEQETVALWVLDDIESKEMLSAALGVPDPQLTAIRPWYVNWIKDGRLHVHKQSIGIDRGAHLLTMLADYDVLDRRSHLFGTG
jgi:hypothetical protein